MARSECGRVLPDFLKKCQKSPCWWDFFRWLCQKSTFLHFRRSLATQPLNLRTWSLAHLTLLCEYLKACAERRSPDAPWIFEKMSKVTFLTGLVICSRSSFAAFDSYATPQPRNMMSSSFDAARWVLKSLRRAKVARCSLIFFLNFQNWPFWWDL